MRLRSLLLKLGAWLDIFSISLCNVRVIFAGRGEIAPNHLRVYANHPNIVDFSEAETTKAHLDISLLQGESNVVEYPLRVAAFASINSVSLFFVR